MWLAYYDALLERAGFEAPFLIRRHQSEFDSLDPRIVQEIVERAIRAHHADPNFDHYTVLEALLRSRRLDSIFDLLQFERNKILEEEKELLEGGGSPTLQWKLSGLSGNFYRDSPLVKVDHSRWVLSLWFFEQQQRALHVSLKMHKKYVENEDERNYFSKNELFVAGGATKPRITAAPSDEVEYPSHALVSFVTHVHIKVLDPESG